MLVAFCIRRRKSSNYALFRIFLITVSSALSPPRSSPESFQSSTTSTHHLRRSFIPRGKFNEGVFLSCIPVGLSKFGICLSFVLMTLLLQNADQGEEPLASSQLLIVRNTIEEPLWSIHLARSIQLSSIFATIKAIARDRKIGREID